MIHLKKVIRKNIVAWNNKFPLDRWWREKYKTSYMSTAHKESSFYSQYFEFHEDRIFKEFRENKEQEEDAKYIPLFGNWWNGNEATKEEIDDWFNSPL